MILSSTDGPRLLVLYDVIEIEKPNMCYVYLKEKLADYSSTVHDRFTGM